MMKKVLYGVALALFASVSVGSLQSCKDDVNDLATQTSYDLSKLKADLLDADRELQRQIDALNIKHVQDVNALLRLIDTKASLQYVNQLVTGLNAADADLANKLAGALNRISALETNFNGLNQDLRDLNVKIDNLKNYVTTMQTQLQGQIDNNKARLDALEGQYRAQASSIASIFEEIEKLKNQTTPALPEDVVTRLTALEDEMSQVKIRLDGVDIEIDQLWQNYSSLSETMGSLYNVIQDNEKKLGVILGKIDNLVTGLLIQGVNCPVFGDFSLPLGVKSNILFNWYGLNTFDKDFKFPSNNAAFSATGDPDFNVKALGLGPNGKSDYEYIPANDTYPEKLTLGTVYVTLNPLGNYYNTDYPLTIVNSKGEEFGINVPLKPSTKELSFGYTRGVEEIKDYLYEGEVVLNTRDNDALSKFEFKVEDGLKVAMKDVLKDPSKRTAVELLKALYDQMGGKLPAYALSYNWDVEMSDTEFSPKSYSVLSQYDLAVATARPLSYNFLADYQGSSKFPIINHISNLIFKLKDEGKLQFKFDPIKINGATITINSLEINPDVTVSGGKLVITIPEIDVVMDNGMTGTTKEKEIVVEGEDLDSVYDAIENGIKDALSEVTGELNDWTSDMESEINGKLNSILGDVESQINKMMDSINGQIDNMLTDLGNQFQPYFDKVNRAVDIYNKIAKKLNNFLVNPNHYLQVTALYGMNGDYGFLSNSMKNPTVFNKKGGNAFSIYLTSYTGELIVPAYKKFVACTAVYDKNYYNVGEQYKINKVGSQLCTVLDGNQIKVLVPADADAFNPDYTYEFTYQAIDYSGYTSTKKFYIKVK